MRVFYRLKIALYLPTQFGEDPKQLMAGARKFALRHITRDDIFALTRPAAELTGLPYVTEVDKEEVEKILG